jgi:hypothetical protein
MFTRARPAPKQIADADTMALSIKPFDPSFREIIMTLPR